MIAGLSQMDVVPSNTRAYISVGDDDARAFAGRLPGAVSRATGLFIEHREALVLTGAGSAQDAAQMIGGRVKMVVVSLGADGAAACIDGRAVAVSGYDVGPSIDTTGASDLFVAAWAWGDAVGLSIDDSLRWAALYAALSVRVPPAPAARRQLSELSRKAPAAASPPRRRAAEPRDALSARRERSVALAARCARRAPRRGACGGGDSPRPRRRGRRARAPAGDAHAPAATPAPPALCRPLRVREVGTRRRAGGHRALGPRPRRARGVLWTLNDSGDSAARLRARPPGRLLREVAVDRRGGGRLGGHRGPRAHALRRRHRRQPRAARRRRGVQFAEPPAGVTSVAAERIALRYPDGAHDAETLLVDPRNGTITIVTKDIPAAPASTSPRSGVCARSGDARLGIGQVLTAGDVSADGRTIVLRSYDRAFVWTRRAASRSPRALQAHALHRRRRPARRGPGRVARAHPRRPRLLHRP